jgi:exodeoxyribonuclease V beta subunit
MKERFGAGKTPVLREALSHIDELAIYTIHGFCKRMLENGAFESGTPFQPEFIEDETPLLEEAAYDFWRTRVYPDAFLSSVTVAMGWEPGALIEIYRTWRRFPDIVLLPGKGDLTASVAKLSDAVAGVRRAWDREAVEALLGADQLAWYADSDLHEKNRSSWIGKAQAFCGGDLAVGFGVLDRFTPSFIREALQARSRDQAPAHPFFDACEDVAPAVGPVWTDLLNHFVEETHKRFEKAKSDRQLLTFDDLLRRLHDALGSEARGAAMARTMEDRFRAALIDEFQDTDPVQCDIFTASFHPAVLHRRSQTGHLCLQGRRRLRLSRCEEQGFAQLHPHEELAKPDRTREGSQRPLRAGAPGLRLQRHPLP